MADRPLFHSNSRMGLLMDLYTTDPRGGIFPLFLASAAPQAPHRVMRGCKAKRRSQQHVLSYIYSLLHTLSELSLFTTPELSKLYIYIYISLDETLN